MIAVTLQPRELHSPATPSFLVDGYLIKRWWPELRLDLSLHGIAADFYLFYAMKDGSEYLQERFEEYSQVVAKQLAIYMDAAVGGELRHKHFMGLPKGNRSLARGEWRRLRIQHGADLVAQGRECFMGKSWGGAYGGPRWAKIADLLFQHLDGKYTPSFFIDLALALQHNTGSVFNKVSDYWHQQSLKTVLDANLSEDWETLLQYASPWAVKLFTEWLTEEELIEVDGFDYSRPREIKVQGGQVRVGCKIRVLPSAKAAEWHGREGKVVKALKDGGFTVTIDHSSKNMSAKSLEILEGGEERTTYEYLDNKV